MDHLMWLALMQELDDAQALPELLDTDALPELLDTDKREQKRQILQSEAAVKALETAWEQASSAVRAMEKMEKHASAETGKGDARQRERIAPSTLFSQSGGHFAFGEDAPSGEKADMEEISRFFERDARRF